MNDILPVLVSGVCGLLLVVLVGAFILSAGFRDAVLGAQGEATVTGILSVKGVAIVLLCGLFLAGLLIPLGYIQQPVAVDETKPGLDAGGLIARLVGIWEAQIPDNHFQMQINWNPSADRFEGRLLKQSPTSEYIGFQRGELVWVAVPVANSNELQEQQKFRVGADGKTELMEWKAGTVDLDKSTAQNLVTSYASFRRIK